MNELLAIILIVLLCCFLFFAWLFALATCPDRMVNLISGTKQNSSPISRASEDLAGADDKSPHDEEKGDDKRALVNNSKQQKRPQLLQRSRSIPANRSNGFLVQLSAEKRANSKKLSVVPEADEQLTVTSLAQCVRPTLPATPSSPELKSPPPADAMKPTDEEPLLEVKTVHLNHRHPAGEMPAEEGGNGPEKAEGIDENKEKEEKAECSKMAENAKADSPVKLKPVKEDEDPEQQLARRSAPPAIQIV